MNKIGILYGMEDSFPAAVVDRINRIVQQRGIQGLQAESLQVGAVEMAVPCGYRLIIDRISQDVPFYRAFLKNAVLTGTTVINNPFWWSADDKFFNYSLAAKLGVAAPKTVLLPHKHNPPSTTSKSMRNLQYPLDWERVYRYIGFPAWLKPHDGGGWKQVYKVHSPEELFAEYDKTGILCMMLQQDIDFEEYYRCYTVNQDQVHVMRYDPRQPHHLRYVPGNLPPAPELHYRLVRDSITLCRAAGYDLNTVEFAVKGGIPYAIDFMNPAPDASLDSVGLENFTWIVEAVADMAIAKATRPQQIPPYHWSKFLAPDDTAAPHERDG